MRILILVLFFFTALAHAATEPSELLQLAVPSGFEGPVHENAGPAHTDAYVRHIAGQERGTLLQITTADLSTGLKGMPVDRRAYLPERYLLQFLGGVERRRSGFKASKPAPTTLGGKPAMRSEWTGSTEGHAMSGVMYSVMSGDVLVIFHTQTFEDAPPQDIGDARRAIEAVTFRSGS